MCVVCARVWKAYVCGTGAFLWYARTRGTCIVCARMCVQDVKRIIGVSNGLCDHLQACEQCVDFCEHEQFSKFSCEQRALKKIQMASTELFRKIQMANSEHFQCFVNFPLAGITLLLIGYVVLRQVIANNLAHTSTDQQMQSWGGSNSSSILQPIVPSACLSSFYGKQPLLRKKKLIPLCTFLEFHTHLEEN